MKGERRETLDDKLARAGPDQHRLQDSSRHQPRLARAFSAGPDLRRWGELQALSEAREGERALFEHRLR